MCRHATGGSRSDWQRRMSQCRRSRVRRTQRTFSFRQQAERPRISQKNVGNSKSRDHSSQKENLGWRVWTDNQTVSQSLCVRTQQSTVSPDHAKLCVTCGKPAVMSRATTGEFTGLWLCRTCQSHWKVHGVNAGDQSANVDESDTIENGPWIKVKARPRTKMAFIQTGDSCRMNTTSSNSISQRNSLKTGVRQGGLQLRWWVAQQRFNVVARILVLEARGRNPRRGDEIPPNVCRKAKTWIPSPFVPKDSVVFSRPGLCFPLCLCFAFSFVHGCCKS